MELLSEKMELEKDNNLVKDQEIELRNLKSKLDKLLDEKDNIDKISEVVDKKLKELNGCFINCLLKIFREKDFGP